MDDFLTEQEYQQRYLTRCQKRFEDIKAFFLKTHSAAEWEKVRNHPARFNRAWHGLLGMPAQDCPPPVNFRR